jgi:glutaredoxin
MDAYTIYSKPGCQACEEAKLLLKTKGLEFNEIILDVGQEKDPLKTYSTVESLKRLVPTARTVPQIFKGSEHLGGLDALKKDIA